MNTRYIGEEFPSFRGETVQIRAIMHDSLNPDPDARIWVISDAVLGFLGGLTAADRVEVVRLRADGAPGVVHFAARALDLALFAAPNDEALPDTLRSSDSYESSLAGGKEAV
ncbi:hypothetical protein LZC95_50300 [Pendulispora brunnea]|uniref:Uncharacterized protein n=1 Tax=Pendulispora brunnea TaxID=2905690 RepID=A0ABZ2KB71_9BACT